MSNVSAASIRPVGPYNPTRRPAPIADQPATTIPGYPQYPSYPMPAPPQAPAMPTWPAPPANNYPTYPTYPQQPQYPSYPQQPQYPGYPQYPGQQPSFLRDVWTGIKERSHEGLQFIAHPFDASARRPYMGRNPWAPRRTGENVGRWIVNIGAIAGVVVGARALLGGFGGGAGVGSSGALGRVVELAAAPFKWAFRATGAVLGGVKDFIGGALSGLFGGARVGFR